LPSMSDCRICQNSLPRHQTFCSHCGARRAAVTPIGSTRTSPFSRLKNFFSEAFRSKTEKRFDDACELARYGFDAAIPNLERIMDVEPDNPRFRSTLAVFYAGAGDERLSHPGGLPGGPLLELRSSNIAERKARHISSWVNNIPQLQDNESFHHSEAYQELDKALNGSLSMFDKSIETASGYPGGYSGRADAFHQVADAMLMACGIFPIRLLTQSASELEGKPVSHGGAHLGICINPETSDLEEFAASIVWLYEQAEENYREALSLDITDVTSHVELSHVLQKLGKTDEASNSLHKALAILNKAIQVCNSDEGSYSERAEILEELGDIQSAISDLERLLTLSTSASKLERTRQQIEELRKSKEVTGEE
jgi:hypothetical protein